MKWFKHDSEAHIDAKLIKVKHKYGMIGYGLYWYCLECIARTVSRHNLTFELEHDSEIIALEWKLDRVVVEEMIRYMVQLGLFEESGGRVTCLKMAFRLDESQSKHPEIKKIQNSLREHEGIGILSGNLPDTIGNQSGHSPDTIGVLSEQNRLEQNRIEENRDKTLCPAKMQDGQKSTKKRPSKFTSSDLSTARWMFEQIKTILNPNAKEPNFDTWANDVRLMRERDNRKDFEIRRLFTWVTMDSFWRTNILSPSKLREKWDMLEIKRINGNGKDIPHENKPLSPEFKGHG